MKICRCVIVMIVLSFTLIACSEKDKTEMEPLSTSVPEVPRCFMPIYFDSEEQLSSTINIMKEAKDDGENKKADFSIQSKKVGQQKYSKEDDFYKLASVDEFYRPSGALKGMTLSEIVVNNDYISWDYVNESDSQTASFTWFREMAPEVAMNELYGRGAASERELKYKGNTFIFLEWTKGYSIHWVDKGNAYQAYIPIEYTDEEILEFCQFKTIKAK